ncbi:MAG TPA: hypothetical protein VN253_12295 [Kofleriaceae bacterium]|nr:hypothetical protein [Kofleriaceae bacterium]
MKTLSSISLGLVLASAAACSDDTPCDPEAPNTICTIAGSGEQGFNGNRGPATKAALYVPQDTAISPDGNLWLLDFNNYVVREILPDGTIHSVIGNGEVGDGPSPDVPRMPALDAPFNHTTDLFFHDGYLYLSAWHNSRVKRVRLSDMMIENYAGRGRRTYYDGDDGPALNASLDLPSSIALDPTGRIVIMDQANQVIRAVDADGTIHRIAGKCVIEMPDCVAGQQLTLCPNTDKYVCGTPTACNVQPCTPGYGGDGGPALEARMGQPFGQSADPAGRVAYDHAGNLIFADTGTNWIRKVDTAGIITTIAGTGGEGGYSGDGGPATQAQLFRPVDIAIGADNSVFFTDVFNNCVRKIDPAGIISTVVGKCSPNPDDRGFAGDGGPPEQAKLDRPYGIDLVGNKLYVSDSYNNRIRVVNLP